MINETGKTIEKNSFEIIRSELPEHSTLSFSEQELAVVVRVIHATGDFEYASNIRFSPDAIERGCAILKQGGSVITDVRMVQAGLSTRFLENKASRAKCLIDDAATLQYANENNLTRAAAAIRLQKELLPNAIIAIGNAPTALLEVLRLSEEEGIRAGLVVGIPVGFVNAAESKDALAQSSLPFITSLGRKGGSAVAAAIVNALGALRETGE